MPTRQITDRQAEILLLILCMAQTDLLEQINDSHLMTPDLEEHEILVLENLLQHPRVHP